MQSWHWNFSELVFISAGTTLLVIFAIPFLPAKLLRGGDARSLENGGNDKGIEKSLSA
jgi:hypothetical protein